MSLSGVPNCRFELVVLHEVQEVGADFQNRSCRRSRRRGRRVQCQTNSDVRSLAERSASALRGTCRCGRGWRPGARCEPSTCRKFAADTIACGLLTPWSRRPFRMRKSCVRIAPEGSRNDTFACGLGAPVGTSVSRKSRSGRPPPTPRRACTSCTASPRAAARERDLGSVGFEITIRGARRLRWRPRPSPWSRCLKRWNSSRMTRSGSSAATHVGREQAAELADDVCAARRILRRDSFARRPSCVGERVGSAAQRRACRAESTSRASSVQPVVEPRDRRSLSTSYERERRQRAHWKRLASEHRPEHVHGARPIAASSPIVAEASRAALVPRAIPRLDLSSNDVPGVNETKLTLFCRRLPDVARQQRDALRQRGSPAARSR